MFFKTVNLAQINEGSLVFKTYAKIRLIINQPLKLYKFLKSTPGKHTVLTGPLEKPLETISMNLQCSGKTFKLSLCINFLNESNTNSLDTRIMLHDAFNHFQNNNNHNKHGIFVADICGHGANDSLKSKDDYDQIFYQEFKNKMPNIKKVGNSLFITDDKNIPELEITRDNNNNIYFLVGSGKSGKSRVTPLKNINSAQKFETWLKSCLSLAEEYINYFYQYKNIPVPNLTLQVEESVEKNNDNIMSLFNPLALFGQNHHLENNNKSENHIAKRKDLITFNQVGGQEKAKQEMSRLVYAIKNPKLYQEQGTKPPRGILLYGPPGTGKTLLAEALANMADADFMEVHVNDIMDCLYGQAEKNMQQVFDKAAENKKKTIIFFDEIDALTQSRDNADGVAKRVISVLLENLNGRKSNPKYFVIAATNKLNQIDQAIIRPGRFDRKIFVGLPDEDGRKQILEIHFKKAEKLSKKQLFQNIDLDRIIETTNNFSGADLAEVIRRCLEQRVYTERKEPFVTTAELLAIIDTFVRENIEINPEKRNIGF